jgi:hypothetical protein
MKTSMWRNRRGVLFAGATVTAAVAAVFAGLAAPAMATPSHPAVRAAALDGRGRGPGYPPPGGIYTEFTNCPLRDPIMQEVMDNNGGGFAACIAGNATSGTIKIGNIVTTVTEPVNVQFGTFIPPGDTSFYPAPVVAPEDNNAAELVTKPDLIPESLTTALGCSTATDPTIEHMCQVAQDRGGIFNQVYALAENVNNVSNFNLLNWTQDIKFQLLNPLLGFNCYIGTDQQPVVVNPQLSLGPGGTASETPDPDPTAHPDTFVLALSGAVATDTTFSAPGVLGCGPGGLANIPIDEALDTSSGLPSASGNNSLTLNGDFDIAACTASEDSTLTQPQDDAGILLSAFEASSTHHGDSAGALAKRISMSELKSMLHYKG